MNKYNSKSLEKIEKYKREVLRDLLVKLSKESQKLFNRMYGDIYTIPEENIDRAIAQCERTEIKQ